MLKVSVIVPVYNAEKFIKDCLNSIFEQTLKDIEVIVIDDGSTDDTSMILKKYLQNFTNKMKIITKENQGQGKARNIGIELAKGEFVTFVDADDKIESDMLQKMYQEAKKEEADVIICDYFEIMQEKEIIKKSIPDKSGDRKRDYIISVAGPCNKLIRTNLLRKNNLRFLETGIYEDLAMIPIVGLYANKIIYLEEPLYKYYIRKGSTMRQNTFNSKLYSIYQVLETLKKSFESSGKLKEYEEELEFIYIQHLLYAANGRFLEYKEGKEQVGKISEIIKSQYPNWRRNKYYKKQRLLFKVTCNVFYSNNLFIILLFQKLKKYIKRGKIWNS